MGRRKLCFKANEEGYNVIHGFSRFRVALRNNTLLENPTLLCPHFGEGIGDGVVIKVECLTFPYQLDDELYCPFDNDPEIPEWMREGYRLADVQKYTVDNMYQEALNAQFSPTCKARFDATWNYPNYVGCFFIEGYWTESSQFTRIDCSASQE